MIPVLETERLHLRGWRAADFEPYAAFYANEATAKYAGGVMSREDAWRDLATVIGQWTLRGYGFWAVEQKQSRDFIGYAGVWHPEGWPEPELGWGLVAPAHGRGFAFEAASRAREHAACAWGLKHLVSYLDPDNHPSRRLAERLGAKFEGNCDLGGDMAAAYRHPVNRGSDPITTQRSTTEPTKCP